MDLTQARSASLALNLDLDLSDEEAVAERQLSGGNEPSNTWGMAGGGRRRKADIGRKEWRYTWGNL